MSEHRLGEVVIERPRGGWRLKTPPGYKKALQRMEISDDEGRKFESLRRPWVEANQVKRLSDNLGPLRRWLRSKVGQPWDDVYSELCQLINMGTLLGLHLKLHIFDFVQVDVVLIDGIPHHKHHNGYQRVLVNYRDTRFYVHPETGILCRVPKPVKEMPKKRHDLVAIDEYHQYRQIKGIWYFLTLADLPSGQFVQDAVLQVRMTPQIADGEYGKSVYAIRKQQCSKKEIKFIARQLQKS
jgi:hypothetical protein